MRVAGFIIGAIIGAAIGHLLTRFAGPAIAATGQLGSVLIHAIPGLIAGVIFSSWFKRTGEATHGRPLRAIALTLLMFAILAGSLIIIGLRG